MLIHTSVSGLVRVLDLAKEKKMINYMWSQVGQIDRMDSSPVNILSLAISFLVKRVFDVCDMLVAHNISKELFLLDLFSVSSRNVRPEKAQISTVGHSETTTHKFERMVGPTF